MSWHVLPDRKASATAAEEAPHVWGIWADDGGAFVQDFAAVLKERGSAPKSRAELVAVAGAGVR
jgi:hypothetical protein